MSDAMCRGANNPVDKLLPNFPRGFNNALNDVLVPRRNPRTLASSSRTSVQYLQDLCLATHGESTVPLCSTSVNDDVTMWYISEGRIRNWTARLQPATLRVPIAKNNDEALLSRNGATTRTYAVACRVPGIDQAPNTSNPKKIRVLLEAIEACRLPPARPSPLPDFLGKFAKLPTSLEEVSYRIKCVDEITLAVTPAPRSTGGSVSSGNHTSVSNDV
ncbi:hypothetical protein BJV77DRAFT_959465 [Russula vinacea]|nr:hypothetical protein BJV77DRAFT_959465 [Russula vinacea]